MSDNILVDILMELRKHNCLLEKKNGIDEVHNGLLREQNAVLVMVLESLRS